MNIIFDMDGTLADTLRATMPAMEEVCAQRGWEVPAKADVCAAIGIANPDFYYALFPNYPRDEVFAAGQQIEDAEARHVWAIGEEILFPHVRAMLERMKALGVRIYIASTGDRAHVEAVLRAAKIEGLFDGIHCHEPEKLAMIGRIMNGGDRAHWAMVGDRDKDWVAARANGIAAIGAGFGYCPESEKDCYDAVCETPTELLAWVVARMGHGEIVDATGRLREERIASVIAHSLFAPTAQKLSALADACAADADCFAYACCAGEVVLGAMVVERRDEMCEIMHIATHPDWRGMGVASRLIAFAHSAMNCREICAETDDDAVGFYRKCGFAAVSLGEKYPGVVRHRCVLACNRFPD